MRVLFFVLCILISSLVSNVVCQEKEGEGSIWERFKKTVQNFVEQLRDFWGDLKEEVKARTADMREWSQEMMEQFKKKMYEWINQSDSSDSEKEDMKNYIERLQMEEK